MTDAVRCRAGEKCRDSEAVTTDDGETYRLGAVTDGPLCGECALAAVVAIRELPDDLIELQERLQPSGAIILRDPDMPTQVKVKKAAPLPFDEYVWTLMELIDYEATLWVESVAEQVGIAWDSNTAEQCRRQFRVEKACQLLADNITALIYLPVQQHRAHSLTTNPCDGHNPDTTTRYRSDYWSNREGWEAALRFIQLHHLAERHIGKKARNRIEVPCPGCNEQRLEREHHNGRVICRGCDLRLSDDDYDAFVEQALETVGSAGDTVGTNQAALLVGVRPTTIRQWVFKGYLKRLPDGSFRRVEVLAAASRNDPED